MKKEIFNSIPEMLARISELEEDGRVCLQTWTDRWIGYCSFYSKATQEDRGIEEQLIELEMADAYKGSFDPSKLEGWDLIQAHY